MKLIRLICFLLIASATSGQSSPFRIFTTSDGLIHNRCGNIVQDSMGYIWITTDNGICNYDGRRFNFFPGPAKRYYFAHNNNITTYRGACIMGTRGEGIVRALGNTVEFICPPPASPGFIMGVAQLDDSSYLATDLEHDRLKLITRNRIQFISLPAALQSPDVYSYLIQKDAAGNTWVATSKGIVIYEKGDLDKPYVIPHFFEQIRQCIKAGCKEKSFHQLR